MGSRGMDEKISKMTLHTHTQDKLLGPAPPPPALYSPPVVLRLALSHARTPHSSEAFGIFILACHLCLPVCVTWLDFGGAGAQTDILYTATHPIIPSHHPPTHAVHPIQPTWWTVLFHAPPWSLI